MPAGLLGVPTNVACQRPAEGTVQSVNDGAVANALLVNRPEEHFVEVSGPTACVSELLNAWYHPEHIQELPVDASTKSSRLEFSVRQSHAYGYEMNASSLSDSSPRLWGNRCLPSDVVVGAAAGEGQARRHLAELPALRPFPTFASCVPSGAAGNSTATAEERTGDSSDTRRSPTDHTTTACARSAESVPSKSTGDGTLCASKGRGRPRNISGAKKVRGDGSRVRNKTYKCEVDGCNKSFRTSSGLSRHSFRHKGEKPNKCDVCDKSFIRYDDLKRHHYIHTGVKPFKCELCDFRCIQSYDLVKHRFTHGGDKPYKCDYCQRKFTRLTRLKSHIRLHTGEKPFRCQTCDECFSQKSSLAIHMNNHLSQKTGGSPSSVNLQVQSVACGFQPCENSIKSFYCRVCSKWFTSTRTLKRHLLLHTNKLYKCVYCGTPFGSIYDLSLHFSSCNEVEVTEHRVETNSSSRQSVVIPLRPSHSTQTSQGEFGVQTHRDDSDDISQANSRTEVTGVPTDLFPPPIAQPLPKLCGSMTNKQHSLCHLVIPSDYDWLMGPDFADLFQDQSSNIADEFVDAAECDRVGARQAPNIGSIFCHQSVTSGCQLKSQNEPASVAMNKRCSELPLSLSPFYTYHQPYALDEPSSSVIYDSYDQIGFNSKSRQKLGSARRTS